MGHRFPLKCFPLGYTWEQKQKITIISMDGVTGNGFITFIIIIIIVDILNVVCLLSISVIPWSRRM